MNPFPDEVPKKDKDGTNHHRLYSVAIEPGRRTSVERDQLFFKRDEIIFRKNRITLYRKTVWHPQYSANVLKTWRQNVSCRLGGSLLAFHQCPARSNWESHFRISFFSLKGMDINSLGKLKRFSGKREFLAESVQFLQRGRDSDVPKPSVAAVHIRLFSTTVLH